MKRQQVLRLFFAALVVLSFVGLGYGYIDGATTDRLESHLTEQGVSNRTHEAVGDRSAITVVATDSNSWRGKAGDSPRARAELVAFNPNGSIRYYNDSHTRYWDVDPVPGTATTVEYMYADHLQPQECPESWNTSQRLVNETTWEQYEQAQSASACTRNGYERVNLTTGEVTRVWSEVTPGKEATRYHDADRLSDSRLVVADIYLDRIFIVNTTSGAVEWTWNASDSFSRKSGGPYPEDWTHINDVEAVDDRGFMVSTRNQDRVVFVNERGVNESATLGREDEYSILYEQHNPDYISATDGGPAIVVGDSENNRVLEYQRTADGWSQTWNWRDSRMQWPRDADRLPNGHTLITDSNGNRVFEVDEDGEVVWSVNIAFPYEAERLGTGDESANGPTATRAQLDSSSPGLAGQAVITLKQLVPGRYLNGLMYITPPWVGVLELFETVLLLMTGLTWGVVEAFWRWN